MLHILSIYTLWTVDPQLRETLSTPKRKIKSEPIFPIQWTSSLRLDQIIHPAWVIQHCRTRVTMNEQFSQFLLRPFLYGEGSLSLPTSPIGLLFRPHENPGFFGFFRWNRKKGSRDNMDKELHAIFHELWSVQKRHALLARKYDWFFFPKRSKRRLKLGT